MNVCAVHEYVCIFADSELIHFFTAPLPPPPSGLMNGEAVNLSSFGSESGLKDCSNSSAARPAKKMPPKKQRSTESPDKKGRSSALQERIKEMKRQQWLQQESRNSAGKCSCPLPVETANRRVPVKTNVCKNLF